MNVVKCFVFVLLSIQSQAQNKEIELGRVYDKDLLYYENSYAVIKVGLANVAAELSRLKLSEWYKSSRLQRELVDTELKKIETRIYLYRNENFSVIHINENYINFSPDSLLIGLFKKSIGASLLFEGKAIINKLNKEKVLRIVPKNDHDSLYSFYFNSDLIFKGTFIRALSNIEAPPRGSEAMDTSNSEVELKNTGEDTTVYVMVDEMPYFEKGVQSFHQGVKRKVPHKLLEGKKNIHVQMVIEKDGRPNKIALVNSKNRELLELVRKNIEAEGNWIPGNQNNSPVRVQMLISVNFF